MKRPQILAPSAGARISGCFMYNFMGPSPRSRWQSLYDAPRLYSRLIRLGASPPYSSPLDTFDRCIGRLLGQEGKMDAQFLKRGCALDSENAVKRRGMFS